MKAVLLAAGRGTRLAPLTDSIPKVLAPLGDRPLLARQLEYLARNGVTEAAINVSHHADQVIEFLDSWDGDLVTRVFVEEELLGTAGALVPMRGFLTEPVILLYGDVVTTMELRGLMERHRHARGIATLAYYEANDVAAKGVLSLRSDGRVQSFVEKPARQRGTALVNGGVHALEPAILDFVGPPPSDFGYDVWPAVIAADRPVYAHRVDGYLRDVGSPEALAAAERDLAEGSLGW